MRLSHFNNKHNNYYNNKSIKKYAHIKLEENNFSYFSIYL